MSEPTRPERIGLMRARMAEIERTVARFRDGLRETNDEVHHVYFTPVLQRLAAIVANEKAGITMHLADDLVAIRSALRRLPLPDIDPDLQEPTTALEVLRGVRGNLVEALDNGLEAAQSLGMEPALTELGQLTVPRNAFANALIRLDERLRVVQDAVDDLASAAKQADAAPRNDSVSQFGLVNVHVRALKVEVSAARFETRIGESPEIPELSDLSVLTRAVADMREIAGDLGQIVDGLGSWLAIGVKSTAGTVLRVAERSWRGLKTVVSVVRRRLARKPDRGPSASPPTDDLDRASDPLAWAKAQHERGDRLFERGKDDPNKTRLEQAVTAYRAALEERTRDRVPLDWAATQNNLGTALLRLGERESGTARLDEAVVAYRAALEENTRDRVPLDWAMTQTNLGTALLRLGDRESGTARLDEAVAAFRAALEERSRDRVPLDWAATQNNLGNALLTLGARESGTARLDEAVTAYRAALEEYTRDRVPLGWAATQNNLGRALATLAERTGDRARMGEAVAAMRNAAEVYREGNVTYWLSIAEGLIAAMQAALAKMGS